MIYKIPFKYSFVLKEHAQVDDNCSHKWPMDRCRGMPKRPLVPKWPKVTLSQWLGTLGMVIVTGNTSISRNWCCIWEFLQHWKYDLYIWEYTLYIWNTTYVSGNTLYISGNTLYISGNTTYVSGNKLYISGNRWIILNKVKFGVYLCLGILEIHIY